jgi:serine/threonine protein kinase
MDIGVPMYMAPETYEGGNLYGQVVDVYSFGVFICDLFGDPSFEGTPIKQPAQLMMRVARGERFAHPTGMPERLWALVNEWWHPDPAKRPTFAAIVDRLKEWTDLMVPGTDVAAYREYQRRLEGERLEDPRPSDLIDALYGLLGWDSNDIPDGENARTV